MEHKRTHQHPSIPLKQVHAHACGGDRGEGCCGGCKGDTSHKQPKPKEPGNQNAAGKSPLSKKKTATLGLAATFAAVGLVSLFTLQKDTAYFEDCIKTACEEIAPGERLADLSRMKPYILGGSLGGTLISLWVAFAPTSRRPESKPPKGNTPPKPDI